MVPAARSSAVSADRTMAPAVQHGAASQCAGLSPTGPGRDHAGRAWERVNVSNSLIRTGTTMGGQVNPICSWPRSTGSATSSRSSSPKSTYSSSDRTV